MEMEKEKENKRGEKMKTPITIGQYTRDIVHSYRPSASQLLINLNRVPPFVLEKLWQSSLCRRGNYCWRCFIHNECNYNVAVRK